VQFVGCHKFQTVADNQPDTVQEPQHIQTIPNPTSNPSANRPTQNPSNLLKQVHNISDPKPVHGQPTATALASTRGPEPVRRHRTAEDTRIVQANLVLKPILKATGTRREALPGTRQPTTGSLLQAVRRDPRRIQTPARRNLPTAAQTWPARWPSPFWKGFWASRLCRHFPRVPNPSSSPPPPPPPPLPPWER